MQEGLRAASRRSEKDEACVKSKSLDNCVMKMEMKKFLLKVSGFWECPNGAELLAQAFSKVDHQRREKAERLRGERNRAASLGAGLLLQYALSTVGDGRTEEGSSEGGVKICTVPWLLRSISRPMPLQYRYGERGKPYLTDSPWHFNLSHSGDYVLCVLSHREVGADIQICQKRDVKKLAGRFFSEEENRTLRQAEDENACFFRLWARKEAYGKLTGEGLPGALGIDLQDEGELSGELCWEEYDVPEGYRIAICQYNDTRK